MSIIEINHLTKEYRLGSLSSLLDTAANTWRRLRGGPPKTRPRFTALDNLNLNLEEGEILGIIGQNGAGKSTLLKILSGITQPTEGSVSVRGSVAPLIEVGAGLVPDLTGRENIILNGTILGIPRKVIRRKTDDIIAFAELEQFLDTPIKRYSSGMQVRLAFAIATSVDADILIVDEVLAVGDLAFQRKCFDRMEDLIKKQNKTVLIVSHNIRQIERMCSRVILLDQGRILDDGPANRICNLFYERSDQKIKENAAQSLSKVMETGEVTLEDIYLLDEAGNRTELVTYGSDPEVCFRIKVNSTLTKPIFVLGIHTTDFVYLTTERSPESMRELDLAAGEYTFRCRLNRFPLLPGVYSLRFSVDVGDMITNVYYGENLLHFRVETSGLQRTGSECEGFIRLDADWIYGDREFA